MSRVVSARIPDELASRLSEIVNKTEKTELFHIQKAFDV